MPVVVAVHLLSVDSHADWREARTRCRARLNLSDAATLVVSVQEHLSWVPGRGFLGRWAVASGISATEHHFQFTDPGGWPFPLGACPLPNGGIFLPSEAGAPCAAIFRSPLKVCPDFRTKCWTCWIGQALPADRNEVAARILSLYTIGGRSPEEILELTIRLHQEGYAPGSRRSDKPPRESDQDRTPTSAPEEEEIGTGGSPCSCAQ